MMTLNQTSIKYIFIMFIVTALILDKECNAQITLDTTIDSTNMVYFFNTVQISSTETKYYLADTTTNTFNLYNMDFTPFLMGVAVPEPFVDFNIYFRAIYVTRSLFDCDTSNIEYAYEAATHTERTFYIMRTDGTELFRLDSANGPYCFGDCLGGADWIKPIVNTSAGAKLFLQRYDGRINIYSLCGTVPEIFDFRNDNFTQQYLRVFPNPTSNSLNFILNPPNNSEKFELVILNYNGSEVVRKNINLDNHNFNIEVKDFSNGVYFYSLCTKNKSYQNGKFIINK